MGGLRREQGEDRDREKRERYKREEIILNLGVYAY